MEQLKMSGKLTVPVVIKPDGIRIDSSRSRASHSDSRVGTELNLRRE